MLVKDRMTPNPITVTEDTSHSDALRLMREHKIRRLPVLDRHGRLVGIISEKDLLYAAPSPATTLSIHELNYALSKLKVKQIMKGDVITTSPHNTIEEAARIIAERKIGCLPVLENDQLAGIITETDIFKALLMLFGDSQHGVRLTLRMAVTPDTLATVLNEVIGLVMGLGGNIVMSTTYCTDDPNYIILLMKVQGASRDLLFALHDMVDEILDVREV